MAAKLLGTVTKLGSDFESLGQCHGVVRPLQNQRIKEGKESF